MDFIYTGSTCIIVHCPDSLYYDSIKLILSYLLFLRWAMWPMGLLFIIYHRDFRLLGMETSTLAEQNDIKVKGQGHLKIR